MGKWGPSSGGLLWDEKLGQSWGHCQAFHSQICYFQMYQPGFLALSRKLTADLKGDLIEIYQNFRRLDGLTLRTGKNQTGQPVSQSHWQSGKDRPLCTAAPATPQQWRSNLLMSPSWHPMLESRGSAWFPLQWEGDTGETTAPDNQWRFSHLSLERCRWRGRLREGNGFMGGGSLNNRKCFKHWTLSVWQFFPKWTLPLFFKCTFSPSIILLDTTQNIWLQNLKCYEGKTPLATIQSLFHTFPHLPLILPMTLLYLFSPHTLYNQ